VTMTGPSHKKRCRVCRQRKNVLDFNRLMSSKDGLDNLCAACRRERTKNNRISRGVGYNPERAEKERKIELATAARQALEDERRCREAFARLREQREEIAGV